MSQFDEAKELVEHTKEKVAVIERAYQESLREKSIKKTLLIEIKNFMENLRSALDFTANGLFQGYGSSEKTDPRIYFPYALGNQTLQSFRHSTRIEACIPGLSASRPDIVAVIEKMQHWNPDYAWLPEFMDLSNENKHEKLTPQTRKETRELRISSGGASIGIGEGASIEIGRGASISFGGVVIPGGQRIDVNNPPAVIGSGRTEVITWVSFHFAAINQPVVPFLNTCLTGVENIVNKLSSM